VDQDEIKQLMEFLITKEKDINIDILKKWTEFLEDEIDDD